MFAWLNLTVLVFSSLLFLYFYVLSVSPAALEEMGVMNAYRRCARYRVIAIFFEFITVINYVLYRFVPLPAPLAEVFPWSLWVSVLIGTVILVPSGWLMLRGILDAGEEAVRPKKEHTMYAGIYRKIRHPQAVGEVFLWWVFAFWLNSR